MSPYYGSTYLATSSYLNVTYLWQMEKSTNKNLRWWQQMFWLCFVSWQPFPQASKCNDSTTIKITKTMVSLSQYLFRTQEYKYTVSLLSNDVFLIKFEWRNRKWQLLGISMLCCSTYIITHQWAVSNGAQKSGFKCWLESLAWVRVHSTVPV